LKVILAILSNMNQKQGIDVSIVVPVYNEEQNIPILFSELEKVLKTINKNVEIIFIDDGSTDDSLNRLKKLKNKADLRIIKFKRNFGQTAALSAGFTGAGGNIIITIDADLQNDPGDIPALINEIEKGYDLVSGWRKNRKDPFLLRRLPSFFANNIISFYTGVKLHDYGCTLKAYRKSILKDINLYGELHRFIPALISWSGASIREIPVKHRVRRHGRSKYGIMRTINVVLDLFTVKFLLAISRGPMQIFGRVGLWFIFFGFIAGAATILMKIIINFNMTGNPLLYLAIFLIILSFQFFALGLLGELNIRNYDSDHPSKHKLYKIDKIIE
jgi:glycosyltransferase involved in cell wall biosynthesis